MQVSVSENILAFISGFGILQAFLLAGLIYFHPKSDKSASSFLAFYIVCMPIPMFLPLLQQFFSWQSYIFLGPFTLLVGPALYLYVRSFKEKITWKKALPHFAIFFIYIFIIGYISKGLGGKLPFSKNIPAEVLHNPITFLPMSLRLVQQLVYYFLSRKTLLSYQQSIRHLYSETSKINLDWIKLLINGYLVLVFLTIALFSLLLRYTEYFNLFVLINAAVVTPYIYVAAFKGVTQPALWQMETGKTKEHFQQEISETEKIIQQVTADEKPKQQKSLPVNDRLTDIVSKITRLMERDKLYQETELTLQQLADKLQAPNYQVSQALNDGMNKNFYDLINGYRVEEAQRLLLDPGNSNYTILSIGFEAGFNSKTTFNTVFKKFTGHTPTEYRNKQRIPEMAFA